MCREIYRRFKSSQTEKPDIHTRLMKKYDDIPAWWFYSLMALSVTVSLLLCTVLKREVQLPWWGLIFACGMAFIFTLPISIITATTNQTPGLNVITEYVMGLIMPGYPIANVCFKVYGYMSMSQAVAFLSDFKLGHYMKIPPKSMFLVQFVGTIVAGTVNIGTAWWLLGSIKDICSDSRTKDLKSKLLITNQASSTIGCSKATKPNKLKSTNPSRSISIPTASLSSSAQRRRGERC